MACVRTQSRPAAFRQCFSTSRPLVRSRPAPACRAERRRGDAQLTDQEPPERPDFWEGDTWEGIGRFAKILIPLIIGLGVAIGGYAANTYNEGARYAAPAASNQDARML
jgi:hypothetical protein